MKNYQKFENNLDWFSNLDLELTKNFPQRLFYFWSACKMSKTDAADCYDKLEQYIEDDMKNDLAAQMYCDKIWEENRLALWKGVDENKVMGYVFGNDMADLLDLARTTYVSSNDTVKKWLDKNDLKVVSNCCAGGQTLKEAYDDYVTFTDEKVTCNYSNFCKRIQSLYTGKTKLKPSKLKIVNSIMAANDKSISTEEINPFTDYIEFKPFEQGEKWRDEIKNSPYSPYSPYFSSQKEKSKKVLSEDETRGNRGNMGNMTQNVEKSESSAQKEIPPIRESRGISNNILNPIERMKQEQANRLKNWDGTIEYEDNEEEFFNRIREKEGGQV